MGEVPQEVPPCRCCFAPIATPRCRVLPGRALNWTCAPVAGAIWLDRGELEKILGAGREDAQTDVAARRRFDSQIDQFHSDPVAWRKAHPYDQRRKRYKYDDDDYHHRKKKRFDIFDIFD